MKDKTIELTVQRADEGQRADAFIGINTAYTRSATQKLISDGAVLVNGKPCGKSTRLREGDTVTVTAAQTEPDGAVSEDIPLDIVFEDDDIIVINKPQGMVVHPAPGHSLGTLVNALLHHCDGSLSGIGGVARPGIVHRIDKDTSGLIAVAKNDASHNSLAAQLADHSMARTYYTVVVGSLPEDSSTIDKKIGRSIKDRRKMATGAAAVMSARASVTHYEVLERFPGYTYAKVSLETGRTHQIRVHMASIGHPVLGDELYGGCSNRFYKNHSKYFNGQCLHAGELTLVHPASGAVMTLTCPLPDNFERILELMRCGTQ